MRKAGLLFLVTAVVACAPDQGGEGNGDGSGDGVADGGTPGQADANPFDPPTPGTGNGADAGATGQDVCDQMDILFVIDDSGSMAEEQTNLAANFPGFISVLDGFVASNGNPIDYRVAVTSTGVNKRWNTPVFGLPIWNTQMGDNGAMRRSCGMPRRWLERADADVAGTFACAADLGINGPTNEMPLEAARLALGDRLMDGTNAGFVRPEALLGIVILTDEEDCSRTDNDFELGLAEDICTRKEPVNTYASFLDDVAGGPGRWAVAVIAGPGPGQCSSPFGTADEARRLNELAQLAGDNGIVSSICEGDLSSGLQRALETFDTACATIPPPIGLSGDTSR